MKAPRTILVTGASSGIGAALARAYAAPGIVLYVSGRNAERLAATSRDCRARGATVHETVLDVAHRNACENWVRDADAARALDLVVANAGVGVNTELGKRSYAETEDTIRHLFAVNVDGVLNTVLPALEPMQARRRGQIAIVSSLASFFGSPGSGAYCATKAAERIFGEALRRELAPYGIEVSVICPGFVRTAMTASNDFPMPFVMDADRAASIILRGLARNRGRIAFPLPMYLAVRLAAALPQSLIDAFSRRIPRKS